VAGRLIVERLDGETLVYDTERNEAHALSGAGAAEFLAAESEVSRRDVLRKLALAGAAAAGTGALVKTIVAPSAAQAQSPGCSPPCPQGTLCCQPLQNVCCNGTCCPATAASSCCAVGTTCCPLGSPNSCVPFTIGCTSGSQCCSNMCCNGICCPQGSICIGNVCTPGTPLSDRSLKRHLHPAGPQDVLAALGL
jgi:hypothetical protein